MSNPVSDANMVERRPMAITAREGDEIIIHDEGDIYAKIIFEKTGKAVRVVVIYDRDAVDVDRGKVYLQKFAENQEAS